MPKIDKLLIKVCNLRVLAITARAPNNLKLSQAVANSIKQPEADSTP